MSEEGSANIGK